MCGIVGYIGSKNAARILLNGLHRLEYRGYDSAGMALVTMSISYLNDGEIAVIPRRGHMKLTTAEMKHGPIVLIDAEMPCVVIATPDSTYDKTVSNVEEIKAEMSTNLVIWQNQLLWNSSPHR